MTTTSDPSAPGGTPSPTAPVEMVVDGPSADGAGHDAAAPGSEGYRGMGPATAAVAPTGSLDEPRWTLTSIIGLLVAVTCSFFVFVQMRPDLLFADTTPSGGDMGAHVWAPAYLRDHLLGSGLLAGWTPDWYAGFPAYHFYMVVPSLAIIAVNAGLRPLFGVPVALVIVALAFALSRNSDAKVKIRIAAVVVALLVISTPYGISFKLISVAGLVAFPLAAWLMGRLARAPEPIPAFLSMASLFFLFDTNFTIYGGNIASTLAGEFAFSISLTLTLVAIGLAIRGMDNGRWRAPAAVVISLIALTHVIPVFYAMVALVVLVVLDRAAPRLWPVATGVALALVPVAFGEGSSPIVAALAVGAALVVLLAVVVTEPAVKARAAWLLVTGPIAMLLSAFWLLPFVWRKPYFNDMGWERLDDISPAMLTVPMKVALPVAVVGALLAFAARERIGLLFAILALVSAAGVANLQEGPLWNARLLPFFYLSVYLLAAVGVALAVRFAGVAIANDLYRPDRRMVVVASVAGVLLTIIAVSVPLRLLPSGSVDSETNTWHWLAFRSHDRSFLPSWTAWNYSGYERKNSYREYHGVVTTMDQLGQINGCGRAMWEYDKELDRYGTPMALMLLPHWTDGCIGSMEGLYFESSATTPFHFLNQSMLSTNPSRAERDLPYQDFDIDRGISQLQVMGVRYYMAQSDEAIEAAEEHPDLTVVGEAQPFVIFEVADSELVTGLDTEPVVVSGQTTEQLGELANRFDLGWVGQAVTYYNDPGTYAAMPAEDGPAGWERAETLVPTAGEPVEPAVVSDVSSGENSVSFTVDEVGVPVLVKTSYFPNWSVSGADGPWRIGPNLMVVVPTDTSVSLDYGRTAVDWLAIVLTVGGMVAVAGLVVLDRRHRTSAQSADDVWAGHDVDWDGDLRSLADLAAFAPASGLGRRLSISGRRLSVSGRGLAGRLVGALDPRSDPPENDPSLLDAEEPEPAAPVGSTDPTDPGDSAWPGVDATTVHLARSRTRLQPGFPPTSEPLPVADPDDDSFGTGASDPPDGDSADDAAEGTADDDAEPPAQPQVETKLSTEVGRTAPPSSS